jgi:hypothetical protein
MESHDEERIAYELKTYGNAIPAYNLRTLPVGMRRIEMLNNIFYTIPGPKMLWQFGEVGYDFSKFLCENGSLDPGCNVSPKPIRWDYFNDPWRRHLYDATASLLQLRKSHDVFETGSFQANLNIAPVRTVFLNHPDMNVAVFANVGTTSNSVFNPPFQHTGNWYEYYTGDTLIVTSGVPVTFSLAPENTGSTSTKSGAATVCDPSCRRTRGSNGLLRCSAQSGCRTVSGALLAERKNGSVAGIKRYVGSGCGNTQSGNPFRGRVRDRCIIG